MKKAVIVGISSSIMIDSSGNFAGYQRSYVNKDYVDSIIKNGGIPMIIPFNEDEEVMKAQMDCVDVLLLSGGHDVSPYNYGQEPNPKLGDVFPERDRYDYILLREAIAGSKPILGICRGMQIINTYFGGTLYQDLSLIGRDVLKHNQGGFWYKPSHMVRLENDTKFYEIFGEEQFMVNSFHHQAIDKLGDGLIISASASDSIIEAIEKVNYPFLVGVQWHPEMLHNTVEVMNKLFMALINASQHE